MNSPEELGHLIAVICVFDKSNEHFAARDNLFPKYFQETTKNYTPAKVLIFSSVLISIMILVTSNNGILKAFEFLILISAFIILLTYLGAALASLKLQIIDRSRGVKINYLTFGSSSLAVIYTLFALYSARMLFW